MPRAGWTRGSAILAVIGVVVVLAMSAMGVPSARAQSGSPNQVGLTLATNGTLTAALTLTVPNGSALRYAMDGNFTPLLSALPINTTTRASLLAEIQALENSPLFAGLFGNRDGTVSALEVSLFASLIESEARLLPGTALVGTGTIGVTLDGQTASATHLTSVNFAGAEGLVTSSAPIDVAVSLTFLFTLSGTQHSLVVSSGSPGAPGLLPPPGTSLAISFTTPPAMVITSTRGLSSVTSVNDLWGWGSASIAGTFAPVTTSSATIDFSNAFPTGYVVIGAILGAVAIASGLLLYRRRRSRNPPAAGEGGVGPSGSA